MAPKGQNGVERAKVQTTAPLLAQCANGTALSIFKYGAQLGLRIFFIYRRAPHKFPVVFFCFYELPTPIRS